MKTVEKIYLQNTAVTPEKTVSEISALLIQAGASQIACEYASGKITGLRWMMPAYGKSSLFEMPIRVTPIYRLLIKQRGTSYISAKAQVQILAQAERIAWRQLLRWVQSQLAMIQCGMAATEEVFLAYILTPSGVSLHETFRALGFLALPAPEVKQ